MEATTKARIVKTRGKLVTRPETEAARVVATMAMKGVYIVPAHLPERGESRMMKGTRAAQQMAMFGSAQRTKLIKNVTRHNAVTTTWL